MHFSSNNITNIKQELKKIITTDCLPKIICVSKTFEISKILPLIEYGAKDFGENKVQEAFDKWQLIKKEKPEINLHLIGKLQSNKVKKAVQLFDYIHSLDNERLADKIYKEQKIQNKKIKLFIQVNIGDEPQKSGVRVENLKNFYETCKEYHLEIIGLMCIPPNNDNTTLYFKQMKQLKENLGLRELSMGMSKDYLDATKNGATFIRIGSKIFGNRV
jgi:pyridoxal phosphate enzyme (YggS family)